MVTSLIHITKMNTIGSEVIVSTYDPDFIETHSDTSDFDLEDENSDVKTEKSSRCRGRKYKEIRLVKQYSSLYSDIINSVELEACKKTNLRSTLIDYDYQNYCKKRNLNNSSSGIDDESIDNTGCSQNNLIDKYMRGESKSADQYFLYDTNNIDTTSYIVTNKTSNNSCSSGNYYINSGNKGADHDDNKNIRQDIYYRIDSNYADNNNRCKSKRIERYVNSESIRIENQSPDDRKLIDNRIRRQDNWADHYIHCEDKRIHNYYNHIENNLTDNPKKSIQPDGHSYGENNWPENETELNSPASLGANRAQANEKMKENKNKIKKHKVYDDLEKEALHSSSSRWPIFKQKCMPHLNNIFGRFGSNAVAQKNTHDNCKWCSPLDNVTLLYCSKCKTARTTKNPIQVVQSIHTLNGNAQNHAPFDKVKYIQYGAARVLQAADVGKNLLELRCSNCSLSSTSDFEMMNEKIRQKLEKRFKKKIKKYLTTQIKKGPVKEKPRQYLYHDITYPCMDVKISPGSASSHFLDSIFRDINKKYQDKQTESIGDSSRKNPNLNTLNARVGGSDCINEIVGRRSSNCHLSSRTLHSKQGKKSHSSSGINKQQQIRPARVDPIVGFGCQCIQRQRDKECTLISKPMRPMYNPPEPIRPIPRKQFANAKVECVCRNGKNPNQVKMENSNMNPRPLHPSPPTTPNRAGPRQHQGGQESCEHYCQQPHDKMLQAVQKQYKGEIICIHNPPCVLINGCLNLPQNTGHNQQHTAVYSAAQTGRVPLLNKKTVNSGLGNMKISNICEKCAKNRTSYLRRGQMSNDIRRTNQGINTCIPYLFDKPLNETSKYQPKLENRPKIVPKIIETQAMQVQVSNNEMQTEDNTNINPDNSAIPKIVNHPTAPPNDVNTTSQVSFKHSTICHNTCGTECICNPDYTPPQMSQGHNSELPICLMNYSDFPVIKENASAQVTPEADSKLENFCVHVPICQKLGNCKVKTEKKDEIPTTRSYKSQTSNINLVSLTVKETVSVQTTGHHSMKSFSIYVPVKKMSKCVSNKSSRKKAQQNGKPKVLETEKHYMALTAVEEISTQVRERQRDSNFRNKLEHKVLTACTHVRRKQRQLICRHHPRCILVHECVGKQLTDSIIAYEDIPECRHKQCCELIPACLARNDKDGKAVSSQRPSNTCHII